MLSKNLLKSISSGFIIFNICLLFLITASGCASMSDVLKSKDEGTVNVYPVNEEQAWKIALAVLRWEDCETIEEHRDENYMLTTTGMNLVSAGTLVGVWVEPVNENDTKVTIVTKRKMQTNIATGLTESTFQKRFAQAVDIIKSGNSLPLEPPAYN
ncbi:MAG TPA: hypothetical protein VLN45_05050 [Ignavibacteriaceae bacterium]|nr:hypothetical protein [Ignavibacteriaceae bacterium]